MRLYSKILKAVREKRCISPLSPALAGELRSNTTKECVGLAIATAASISFAALGMTQTSGVEVQNPALLRSGTGAEECDATIAK